MRMKLLATCLAAATLVAPAAFAQQTCEQQQNQRVAGTLGGGAIGAVVGGAAASKGRKTEGAILGAIVGGVIGNQVSKPKQNCASAYGFYDADGRWHASNVSRNNATGFYGAQGEWVDGPPRGRYNDRRQWETADGGFYDNDGRWVPPGVDGYYGPDNRWIAVDARVNAGRSDDRYPPPRYDERGNSHDVVARINMIRDRVNDWRNRGDLRSRDARTLNRRLDDISYRQARMPHRGGYLYPVDEENIQRELDRVEQDARRMARR